MTGCSIPRKRLQLHRTLPGTTADGTAWRVCHSKVANTQAQKHIDPKSGKMSDLSLPGLYSHIKRKF